MFVRKLKKGSRREKEERSESADIRVTGIRLGKSIQKCGRRKKNAWKGQRPVGEIELVQLAGLRSMQATTGMMVP